MSDSLEGALQRLQAEIDASHRAAIALQGCTRDELAERLDRELSIRAVIDEACRHWIASGSWPKMEPDLAHFVFDRVFQAHMFAGWLYVNGFRNPTKTENQLLDFLLIDHWEGNGIHRLRAGLIEME